MYPRRPYSIPYGSWCVFLLLAGCILAGCAPKKPADRPIRAPLWRLFQQEQATLHLKRQFSIRTSINYTSTQQKHRVIMRLYGYLAYPIRMNLEAGIGRTVSIWREDASLWQAYFPEKKRMYIARDGKTGARCIGFPTPFDLRELALLLQGDIASVLPPNPVPGILGDQGQYIFFPLDNRITKIFLDKQARLIEIYGEKGWKVLFDYDNSSPYSQKMSITMDNNTRATIRVKSVNAHTFDTDLPISLEKRTKIISLDGYSGQENCTTIRK